MNLIGHRACSAEFPENSVAAIRGCAPHVDMIEIDVRRCGSGEIVVFHDDRLDRLTERSGRVADTPRSELSELTIGDSDEPIPTIDDALSALPAGTGLNVELKHAGMGEELLPKLRSLDQEVLVSSFETDAIREFAPTPIPTGYLFAENTGENLAIAAQLRCEAIHPRHELVDEQLLQRAVNRGVIVNAWTVPTAERFHELRRMGVNGAIVDSWTVTADL